MGTHPKTHSAICPFCRGGVPEATLRFGGTCSHCMLEIPGEEAPTDPGLVARNKQAAEERERAKLRRRRNLVIGAVAAVFLVGASFVGYAQYQERQQALVYELDDYYQVSLSDLQGPPEGVPATPEVVAAATPGPKATGSSRKKTFADPGSDKIVTGTTAPEGTPATESSGMKQASGGGGDAALPDAVADALGKGGTSSQFGAGAIDISRPTLESTLSDPDQIKSMAKRVIDAGSPQLQSCYNQRLKASPELAGAWKVYFVISQKGTTKDVSVKGVNAEDGELEACMVRAVQGWRFTKIVRDQPVSKTYRFGASSW